MTAPGSARTDVGRAMKELALKGFAMKDFA